MVPKDFQAFLRNSENKNRLINLLCDTIFSSSDTAFVILQPVQKNYYQMLKPLHQEVKDYVEDLLFIKKRLDNKIMLKLFITSGSSSQEGRNA